MFWHLKKHKFINLDFEMSKVEVPLNMRSKLRKELVFFLLYYKVQLSLFSSKSNFQCWVLARMQPKFFSML